MPQYWKKDGKGDNKGLMIVNPFKRKATMRKAAYILAVERVAEATRVRGLYP